MTFAPRRIDLAFAVSALLHLGILFGALILPEPPPPPPPQPPLQARLKTPPPAPAPEPIVIPQPSEEVTPPPPPAPKPPPPKTSERPVNWQTAARQQLQKLNAEGLLYSPEAIAAGLEGTAVVLLVMDESGKVVATRIEESSGHPLLDRDARNAGMRLRFPADTPGEVVLPIRFRLR